MEDLFPKKDPHAFGKAPPPPPKYKKRRRIDPNEDLKAIRQVIKDIADQDITLEDFVLLVSPHTGDKGAILNQVMTEDIAAFHKMVIKIYDTMTQDVSDVLANEQMDLAKMYAEKQRIFLHKIERALREIHNIHPDFDFRDYYKDPVKYLATIFKLAEMPDDEEVEIARRQLTYHRLQWLQSEGERLQAENYKLQGHLNQLKKIQRDEIVATVKKEQEEEQKKAELEKQQAEMLNKLENLNDKLHGAIVGSEKKKVATKKKEEQKAMKKGRPSLRERQPWQSKDKEDWNIQAAAAVEELQVAASKATLKSTGKVSLGSRPTASRPTTARPAPRTAPGPRPGTSKSPTAATGAVRKKPVSKKKVSIKERPAWHDVDLEEFGVSTAPAEEVAPRRSPRSVQAAACSDTCASARSPPSVSSGRRARAPRDSWGGF